MFINRAGLFSAAPVLVALASGAANPLRIVIKRVGIILDNRIVGGSNRTSTSAANQVISRTRLVRLSAAASILLAGLFLTSLSTANAATKTSQGSGNWTTITWSPAGAPGSTDDVVIRNGDAVVFNTTVTIASLQVGQGTSGTLTMGNDNTNRTLTVAGNVTVSAGATFNSAGDGGNVLNIGGTGTLSVAGIFDMNVAAADTNVTFNGTTQAISGAGATADFNTITINSGSTVTLSRAITIAGLTLNGKLVNSGTVTNSATTTVGATGTYQHAQNSGTIPTATWAAGSTCLVSGTVGTLPTGLGQAFSNFTWNCTGQTTTVTLGNTLAIGAALTIQSTGGTGELRLAAGTSTAASYSQSGGFVRISQGAGARTLTVSGAFSLSGGTIEMSDGTVAGTLNANGATFSHTSGTIQESGSSNGAVVFNGGATTTYTSGGTVSGTINFTVSSGTTLQMGTGGSPSTATGGGTFTLSSGATLGITSTAGITSSGATGNIQSTTRSFSTGANYIYNGSSSQVTGNGLPATLSNWTVSNTAGLSLTSGVVINGTCSVNASCTLTVASATLDIVGTLTINAAGDVVVNSGGILKMENLSTSTTSAASLTFNSGGKYQHGFTTNAGTVPTATWNTGSTCEIVGYTSGPGDNVTPGGLTQSFYNFTWNCPSQTANVTMGGDLSTVLGNLTIVSTGAGAATVLIRQSGDGVPFDLTITGDLIIQGGILDLDSGDTQNHAVNLAGFYNQTGGTLQTSGDAGVAFNFMGANKTFTRSAGTFDTLHSNFTVTSGAFLTLNAGIALQTGATFTVSSGGTLNCGANNLTGAGAFILSSGGTLGIGSTAGITSAGATGNIQTTTRTYSSVANYTYNGSAAQATGVFTTAPTANTVANLTINNAAGVTLSSSRTVTGILALTTGDLTTGANTLTQTGTSTGNGDVVGTVSRSDVNGTARPCGNPNVQIKNTGILTVGVVLVKGLQPLHLASGVKRQYTINPSGGTVSNATVRLHYLDSERNGNADATLECYRSADGGLHYASVGANSRGTAVDTNRWVEVTGQAQFSPWALAGPNAPTAVEMVGYVASHSRDGKVLLQWETGREVNNLGFNIYREEAGQRVRLNKSLIVGSGLTARPGTVMSAGRSYAWMISAAQAKESALWIEEIDFSGRTVWHGPIHSQESAGGALTLSTKQQAIIEQTSTVSDLAQESTFNGVARPVQTFATITKPSAMKTTGAVINPQPPISLSNPGVKLTLKQEGWYRIAQPQLVAAGLNPSVDPSSLQLFADGVEVPMSVTTNNGVFDSTSAIEFYGLPIDTPSTDSHVYTLTSGSAGKRVQSVTGQGGLPPTDSFLYTVERKDRSIYVSGVHNGDAENFFGSVVSSSPVDQALTLTNVDATAAGQATIEVGMQGLSMTPHVVTVNLNGNAIGTISYDSQAQGVAQFTVQNSSLLEGQNLVTLSGQQGVFDLSLVDHIRVSYWHSYAADGNALKFTAMANQQLTLSGFTSADVKVFDVTDPSAPQKVEASVTSQKISSTFAVTVAIPGTGARTLLAIGDDQTRSPLAVLTNKPSTWKSKSNAADLVIITHDSLTDSFKQLQTLRQSQGLKVALVDVDDIYDEFNSGNKSPQAIKDFLAYAKANWKAAPKYVLLAGSASYDPKNYNGLGGFDLVPTKLIDTSFSETASDDWFADFNMDGIAEMAVGRLPVPSSEEAQTTVTKLAAYQNGDTFNSSLLVADGNEGFDFEAANASLATLFPGSMTVQQIDRGQIGTAAARQQLLDGIASGQKIINYVGHGSPSVWRDNLLTSADALALTNIGRYPLFIAMTCLNGEFQHPELNILASALMNSREGGAIAVWASSGFTIPAEQAVMNQQFYTLLFQSNQPTKGNAAQASLTLGEITNSAKSSVSDLDVRRTWILFGDPSMTVK